MLAARADPARIARPASGDGVERPGPAAVNDIRDAAPRNEPLVVVLVSRKGESDAVALEEWHPAPQDVVVRVIRTTAESRMVEDRHFPESVRRRQRTLEPRRLPGADVVRVEHEE